MLASPIHNSQLSSPTTDLLIVSAINTSQGPEEVRNIVANPFNIIATGFKIGWLRAEPGTNTYTYTTLNFSWLALGPE